MTTMTPKNFNHFYSHQLGLGIIEVLISIVVLSVGLLASAKLFVGGRVSSETSGYAILAIGLAKEYAEIVKMDGLSPHDATSPYLIDTKLLSIPPGVMVSNCSAKMCPTSLEWSLDIKQEWARRVADSIPGGRAVVCVDQAQQSIFGKYSWTCSNQGSEIAIKVGWTDRTDTSSQDGPQVVISLPLESL